MIALNTSVTPEITFPKHRIFAALFSTVTLAHRTFVILETLWRIDLPITSVSWSQWDTVLFALILRNTILVCSTLAFCTFVNKLITSRALLIFSISNHLLRLKKRHDFIRAEITKWIIFRWITFYSDKASSLILFYCLSESWWVIYVTCPITWECHNSGIF